MQLADIVRADLARGVLRDSQKDALPCQKELRATGEACLKVVSETDEQCFPK